MGSLLMDELPAARALGSLFKSAEVHLWVTGSGEVQESSYCQVPSKLVEVDELHEKKESDNNNGFSLLAEDVELAETLNELGLPLSFCTNKEKRNETNSGKRRGARKNNKRSPIDIDNHALASINTSEESMSPASLIDASEFTDQSEIPKLGTIEVNDLVKLSVELDESLSLTACLSTRTSSNDYGCSGEVSDLGFYRNFGHGSELGNDSLDQHEHSSCTSNMMPNVLCPDGGTLEEWCLVKETVELEGKEMMEQPNSVNWEGLVAMAVGTEEKSNDISFKAMQDLDTAACVEFSELATFDMANSHRTNDSGEWFAYWDDFNMQTYFYNVKTEESTWDPPAGMEHLVYHNVADEPTNKVDRLIESDQGQVHFGKYNEVEALCDLQPELDLGKGSRKDNGLLSQKLDDATINGLFTGAEFCMYTTERKKKVRRTKLNRKSSSTEEYQGVLHEEVPTISKYWCQRYLLFSKFDYGIKMDEEGWFSVTPEALAKHHAARCSDGSIVDFFTGVGGNAIQFAQCCKHVIAIDIDPNKIEYARHNASLYGVDNNIDFINGDSFSLVPKLKIYFSHGIFLSKAQKFTRANVVFMSPPWGGPDYSKVKTFDINTMLKPHDGQFLFNAGKKIASKIVMFLPRNVDVNQLAELCLSANPPWSLEVERNFLNGRLKGVTAYFLEPSIL